MSNALPSYFRTHANDARRGGNRTYATAGIHLGIHIASEVDEDELTALLDATDNGTDRVRAHHECIEIVWNWFAKTLPRCRALVPVRRRETFICALATGLYREGILEALPRSVLIESYL